MKPKLPSRLPAAKLVKAEPLERFAVMPKELKAQLASPKDFKAAVIVDHKGSPKYFLFDTCSLWDLLCAADSQFEKTASAKEYIFHNRLGWLIDAIEERMPINPRLIARLKKGIKEAQKLGTVPLDKIKRSLGSA